MDSTGGHNVFSAIADSTRRELLGLLADGEQSVMALTGHFQMSRTAVSKHLTVLREAGLVTERKAGRERRYRLHAAPLQEVRDWVTFFERFWAGKLEALQRHLEENPSTTGGIEP